MEDAPAMYRNWASDPEVTKYLTWPPHANISVTESILTDWIGQYKNPDYYQWAITLKTKPEEPIGSISVVEPIDNRIQIAHIGYCIGKNWWHQGITSEALTRLIEFLFEEVGFNKVESRHAPENPNSGKVMQKACMKYEGTIRQHGWNNQGICDDCYYGLLKSEYLPKQG